MALDMEKEFLDFMKGGLPILLEDEKNQDDFDPSAFVIPDAQLQGEKNKNYLQRENYELLYRKMTPAILHSTIMNKHLDIMEYIDIPSLKLDNLLKKELISIFEIIKS